MMCDCNCIIHFIASGRQMIHHLPMNCRRQMLPMKCLQLQKDQWTAIRILKRMEADWLIFLLKRENLF